MFPSFVVIVTFIANLEKETLVKVK